MARKPKKRKILFQVRRLVREVLSGKHKTLTSAGKAAGYSGVDSAGQALSHLQGTMSEIMDQIGLTDAALIEKSVLPLLNAARTKYFHHKGQVKDTRQEPALEIRRDELDMALRIKGKYAPLAVEQPHKHTVQVLLLDASLRPKRDFPPPTTIEIANTRASGDAGETKKTE
jgi:hypothetical protein